MDMNLNVSKDDGPVVWIAGRLYARFDQIVLTISDDGVATASVRWCSKEVFKIHVPWNKRQSLTLDGIIGFSPMTVSEV